MSIELRLHGFGNGDPVKFNGGFLEADYLALPWVMAIMRYDMSVNFDFLNGASSGNYTLRWGVRVIGSRPACSF